MSNFLCWYSKHWFLSFILLSVIIMLVIKVAGIDRESIPSYATVLVHALAVFAIRQFNSKSCLEEEKQYYSRQAAIATAKLS